MRGRRTAGIAALAALVLAATAAPALAQGGPRTAVARMLTSDGASAGRVELLSLTELLANGGSGESEFGVEEVELTGRLTRAQRDRIVVVAALLRGLPAGFHGFHVHEQGTCEGPSFASAGGHFNPTGASHPRHAGDMPLLYVSADGTATAAFLTDRFDVGQLFDVDGSAIVVHANPDNYANIPTDRYDPDPDEITRSTGDAGDRIACGVVSRGRLSEEPGESRVRAVAPIRRSDGSLAGSAAFMRLFGKVAVVTVLAGVPRGFHGLHVHETGRCRRPSFESAGGHFNPTGAPHGAHAGDLPVVYVMRMRFAVSIATTDRFRIRDLFDVDGSAVVVHARPDNYANIPPDRYDPDPDEATLATGDAGERIGCGVVHRLVRCTVEVSPRRYRAGERAVVRARVRAGGRPLRGAAVVVNGPGFAAGRVTNARGIARIPIRPRSPGPLRVEVVEDERTLGCSARARILPARGALGPALAGRAL